MIRAFSGQQVESTCSMALADNHLPGSSVVSAPARSVEGSLCGLKGCCGDGVADDADIGDLTPKLPPVSSGKKKSPIELPSRDSR